MRAVEAHGQGVDGEVAAVQVELDRPRLHVGQGRWPAVELLARRHKVDLRRPGQLGHVGIRRVGVRHPRLPGVQHGQHIFRRGADRRVHLPRERPLGRAKALVAVQLAAETGAQFADEADGIPLNDDVEVGRRLPQQQVAHQPPNEVDGHLQPRRRLADHQHQRPQLRREGASQLPAQIALRRFGQRLEQDVEQVSAGDDADRPLPVAAVGRFRQHRNLSPPLGGHELLDALNGVRRAHGNRPGAHDATDRLTAHLVAHGAVDRPPRHQPDHAPLALIDHRVALVAVLLHQRGYVGHRRCRRHGQHAIGHDLGHAPRRLDGTRQQFPHAAGYVRQPPADDHRRRRPAMAAAA